MAAVADTAEMEGEPVEFKSKEEEDAYFAKLHRVRSQQKQTRRMTMMGGLGLQGPQEHCGFFKLNNNDGDDVAKSFALRAGTLLKSVSTGILGASFRPLRSSNGEFEWVFKVHFKSPEDVEVFYDGVEDMVGVGAQELVSTSLMIDLPGLRGSVKGGTSELLALFKASGSEAGAPIESMLDMLEEAAPKGMTSCSMRVPHADAALYDSYKALQPGYTHALVATFEDAARLDSFVESGTLTGIYGPLVADKTIDEAVKPLVLSYEF